MNWRPRFSLRSLLLCALLAGSGMLLWRNWSPWIVVRNFADAAGIDRAGFSPDGRFAYFYPGRSTEPNAPPRLLRIYYSHSGSLALELPCGSQLTDIEFSPGGKYVQFS